MTCRLQGSSHAAELQHTPSECHPLGTKWGLKRLDHSEREREETNQAVFRRGSPTPGQRSDKCSSNDASYRRFGAVWRTAASQFRVKANAVADDNWMSQTSRGLAFSQEILLTTQVGQAQTSKEINTAKVSETMTYTACMPYQIYAPQCRHIWHAWSPWE